MDLLIATIFIFVLRLADQSLGTMRTLLVNKNRPVYAAFLGFIESAIWIIAVSQVIKDINDPILIVGYAGGFAAGTILGSYLEKTIGLGDVVVRVFTPTATPQVAPTLRESGYGVTVINGDGRDGSVTISWCIVPRRKLKKVLRIIKDINSEAYVTTDMANPISLNK